MVFRSRSISYCYKSKLAEMLVLTSAFCFDCDWYCLNPILEAKPFDDQNTVLSTLVD
jgi:hypothetical protein